MEIRLPYFAQKPISIRYASPGLRPSPIVLVIVLDSVAMQRTWTEDEDDDEDEHDGSNRV